MKRKSVSDSFVVRQCLRCGCDFKAPNNYHSVCEHCLVDSVDRSKRFCWLDSLERDKSLDRRLDSAVKRLLSIPVDRLERSLGIKQQKK